MKTGLKIIKKGLDDVLSFGRYKGRTIREMLEEDPNYLTWAHTKIGWFKLEPDVMEAAVAAALQSQNDYYDADELGWLDEEPF